LVLLSRRRNLCFLPQMRKGVFSDFISHGIPPIRPSLSYRGQESTVLSTYGLSNETLRLLNLVRDVNDILQIIRHGGVADASPISSFFVSYKAYQRMPSSLPSIGRGDRINRMLTFTNPAGLLHASTWTS
jgi:hypothetical protein